MGRVPQHEASASSLDGFAESLLAVIDEGRRTATYKLALLLALLDCAAEAPRSLRDGARVAVHTRDVADAVARYYWQQLRPFPGPTGLVTLRQITNKRSGILAALEQVRSAAPTATSWDAAKEHAPGAAGDGLDRVETTVARYPLLRLQVLEGATIPFLYEVPWDDRVTLGALHAPGGGLITFQPGAPKQLVRLAPLVRPLVELHWVRMVAVLNQLNPTEDDLRTHLFGAERVAFPPALRSDLLQLQSGACFYCRGILSRDAGAVDHFVPWSRWPNNAVENLVLAHGRCNGLKSDRIPGPVPLERWAGRLRQHRDDLKRIAVSSKRESRYDRSVALARSMYRGLPQGTPLWNAPGDVVRADRTTELLALLPRG